ncbi:MAG: cystathionine beta-lyase, partial [Nocardioidaceae bacterium]
MTDPLRPLRALSLPELSRRTSAKWRVHPADVLPLWVAEMDAPLAPAVVEAVTAAVAAGDTGYAMGTSYVAALRSFAADRWGWTFETEQASIVPDVMHGLMEMVRLVSGPGDAVVVNPPVYPPFYGFLTTIDRRPVDAPLGPDGRLDLDALE